MAADEGRGATLTLGTSTWDTTALITSITPDPITREILNTSHLLTTNYHTKLVADLADAGGFSVEFHHDGDAEPPITGAAETATITYPLQGAWSTGPLITASAQCDSYTPGAAEVGVLMKGQAHFTWLTAPTFTDHT